MINFNLGEFLVNPQPFVDATRVWIETNAFLLGGCATAALLAAGTVGFGSTALIARMKRTQAEKDRFGGKREAKKAGLFRNPGLQYSGIPIGKIGKHHLCWVDQEPVLVTGGTRSGKGVGVIRPACLTYGGPLIAYDGGKGELFRDTAGYRARFSHVLKFDLTDTNGVYFNFLDEVDPHNPVGAADNLAKAVPRPERPNGFFESGAERLMGAVILHVLFGEPADRKNMARVVEIISQGDAGLKMIIEANAHPVAVNRAMAMFAGNPFTDPPGGSEKERGGMVSSALNRLAPFEDPIVAQITSRSDFKMRDLFRLSPQGRPVTLYLTTPASEDDRLKPINSMFLSMFLSSVMAEQPALEGEPRTLLVLDEFASLRMEILQRAITKIVGSGCTMLLGAQSLTALSQEPYGPFNQFRDNIRCYVAYAANDMATQRDISQASGKVTEPKTSFSKSRSAGSWGLNRSETHSETDKAKIEAGDVRCMPDHEELVFITGQPVIRAQKIRDYKDPVLKKRLALAVPATRAADGVYPGLPHPQRQSPWAASTTISAPRQAAFDAPEHERPDEEPERPPYDPDMEEAPKPKKPRAKRKLITATGE